MKARREKPSVNLYGVDLLDAESEFRVLLDGQVTDLRGVLPKDISNKGMDLTECEEVRDGEVRDDIDHELGRKLSQVVIRLDRHCWSRHKATMTGS
jgi:hypothetical protein